MRLYLNSLAYSSFDEPRGFDSKTRKGPMSSIVPSSTSTALSPVGTTLWSPRRSCLSNESSTLTSRGIVALYYEQRHLAEEEELPQPASQICERLREARSIEV